MSRAQVAWGCIDQRPRGRLGLRIAHQIDMKPAAVTAMLRDEIFQRRTVFEHTHTLQEQGWTFRAQSQQFGVGTPECDRFHRAISSRNYESVFAGEQLV